MKSLPFHKLLRVFWLLMAFHIFNCSIDAPDGLPIFKAEDLSINEMESISEVVLEKCLGFSSAVPEHDENDQEEGMDFKLSKYVPPQLWHTVSLKAIIHSFPSICGFPAYNIFSCQYNPGTDAPPPKKV